MCGIAGYLARTDRTPRSDVLGAMTDAIEHRGPDDSGFFRASTSDNSWNVALGHRRLSIIDLSGGHQPMGTGVGAITVVFNGEIYNFRALRDHLSSFGHAFSTESDTEVLLKAYQQYGPECVNHLHGMFSFALWDRSRERLMLARDRFGKKPLFLYHGEGLLAFASEIKALLRLETLKAEIDLSVIGSYLLYRYVPGPATLYRGIVKLPPGSIGLWEEGVWEVRGYYRPPDHRKGDPCDLKEEPIEAFERCLDKSVRLRMVSDVPFGAFLSGGLDSSTVVALMSRHSELPVRTFSVGFRESEYSELDHARAVATRYSTIHHELVVSESELIEHLPALVRFRDGPVCEPSDIPIYLLSREAAKSVKMVLTGEGSDEFLGGYPKHRVEMWGSRIARIPRSLRRMAAWTAERGLPYGYRRVKIAASALACQSNRSRYVRWFGALAPELLEQLAVVPEQMRDPWQGDQFDVDAGVSPLRAMMYFDQRSWLPDNLLERGDRMTMAASIEARMPFMDHVLAELVHRLPDEYLIRNGVTKWVLRQAAQKLIPKQILERPKVGFRVPVNEWFRNRLKGPLEDMLCGPDSRTREYYRAGQVKRILREHTHGVRNHEKLLWTLWNLEIWHRECL